MSTKHQRRRWKTKRGRRAAAEDQHRPTPPSSADLQSHAWALVAAGLRPHQILDPRPRPSRGARRDDQ